MWTHLERQAGGKVRGMGEKQIEVDKRLLRTRMGQLRRSLDDVRMHRKQYRERRAQVCSCCPSHLRLEELELEKLIMSACLEGTAESSACLQLT